MNKFLFSAALIAVFGLVSCEEQAASDESANVETASQETSSSAITADNVELLSSIEFAEDAFDLTE